MKITKEEFIAAIENMNAIELKEFIALLEEKLFAKEKKEVSNRS